MSAEKKLPKERNSSKKNGDPAKGVDPLKPERKFILRGQLAKIRETLTQERFPVREMINLDSSRGGVMEDHEYDETEIAQLTFEDGVEWMGYMGDLEEIFGARPDRGKLGQGVYLPKSLSVTGGTDRGFGKVIQGVLFKVFGKTIRKSVREIILKTDRKIVPDPGLFALDKNFNKSEPKLRPETDDRVLLLLHGVLSNFENAFDGLNQDENEIFEGYDHVLAFDHYTLHKNPIENALEILKAIPDGLTLDLLSHSRRGLVGDVLCRCDYRNELLGFSEEEVLILTKNEEVSATVLQELNRLAGAKRLKINNFVRVACPAQGTTLLSERLDHYLNLILNSIGIALGRLAVPICDFIREFILEVINCRARAEDIPGLWAMTPASSYQKVNNNRKIDVSSKLYVIAGDAEIGGGIKQTLLTILTNLFYRHANDFAVDTKSMKRGLTRTDGLFQFVSKSSQTNHFNYFNKDRKAKTAILMALNQKADEGNIRFEQITRENVDRGVGISIRVNRYNFDNVSGTRPIAILIPGIMGSTLQDGQDDIWLNLLRIARGDMVAQMGIKTNNISPSGVFAQYYRQMGALLLEKNDLKVFAFDWRKSLREAAEQLKALLETYLKLNQPINIIAHSMGGLVVKQVMFLFPDLWERCFSRKDNKVVFLGTPWYGSHLILEVLTGHSSRIKQLALLDLRHNKSELLRIVSEYPGVLELLPLDLSGFEDESFKNEVRQFQFKGYEFADFWDLLRNYATDTIHPDAAFLSHIREFKYGKNEAGIAYADFQIPKTCIEQVYYIAGQKSTVFGCKIKRSIFSGKQLKYLTTERGDGSVTWSLGIPRELREESIFYSQAEHVNLANDRLIFEAIRDIIVFGKTDKLPHTPIMARSSDLILEKETVDFVAANDNEAVSLVLGAAVYPVAQEKGRPPIGVSVYNGDLNFAHAPVMVGHFKGDGLYNAEKALDNCLNGKLSERLRLGFYPNNIGDSEITYHSQAQPKGAVMVGLGSMNNLTGYQLALSVEKAVVKYAFFFRDNYELSKNKEYAKRISCILIGSSFGGLPVETCVQAILTGIQKANDCIHDMGKQLVPIELVEFVDYYEDKAQQCYLCLKKLEADSNQFHIEVQKFEAGVGRKQRIILNDNAAWWHTLTTSICRDAGTRNPTGLAHTLSDGKARVEQSHVYSDLKLATYLSDQFSDSPNWDYKLSKTLFELLIPNDFKNLIKNQNNVIWNMDEYTAQFPWEMFHDYLDDRDEHNEIPTFVNTGLVRQFITDQYRSNPVFVDQRKALIIGDPDYSDSPFSQLPGAAREAKMVTEILDENEFKVLPIINGKAAQIIREMYSDDFKIMHIAAHGVYDCIEENGVERFRAGVVLGDGLFLEPGTLNQLSSIPEFVFINCCYSGAIKPLEEKYYKHRPHLAANIGIQLIQMGVKAVVIAGWAVDDDAAQTFAREFYTRMFEGYEFGEAVKKARRKCYDQHQNTNTWGAYQCYGDHFFKLSQKKPETEEHEPYVTPSQAVVDLSNMLSVVKGQKVAVNQTLEAMEAIKKRVNANGLENPAILEYYAMIYSELGQYEAAVEIFKDLLNRERATFTLHSIEQYLSIRTKLLLTRAITHREKYTVEYPSCIEEIQKEQDDLIADLGIVAKLGMTAERNYLLGATHRRASMICSELEGKRRHLLLMRDYYQSAFQIIPKRGIENLAYALSNYLFAHYFINPEEAQDLKSQKKMLAALGLKAGSVRELLTCWLAEFEILEEGFHDFYPRSAGAKILSCLYVYEGDEFFIRFQDKLLDALKYGGNFKNILGEQEHLLFLMEQYPRESIPYLSLSGLREQVGRLAQMG